MNQVRHNRPKKQAGQAGTERSDEPMVRDEVCGMRFSAAEAAASTSFAGKTYYFCTKRCRERFLEHPGWYVPVGQESSPASRMTLGRSAAPTELETDRNGAVVSSWFVRFVPAIERVSWHRFLHPRRQHVFAIRPESPDTWTIFEAWQHRMLSATLRCAEAQVSTSNRLLEIHPAELIPGSRVVRSCEIGRPLEV